MPRGLPDRWLDYRSVGKRLVGTRFIAFKVPLKQALNRPLSPSDAFGPWDLMEKLRLDHQELGLIIDLTNTDRYYTQQDMPNWLLLVKIKTRGHEIPNDATILSFKCTVRRFLRENLNNDKLIGVHCTHGLNRTGYLICRYLIDVEGMDPEHAIHLFNSSRGHDIERENYLSDLQYGPKRSNRGIDEFEPQRGGATHRPRDAAPDSYDREDRRAPGGDSWDYRSSSRGLSHRPHHRPPHDTPRPDSRFRPQQIHSQPRYHQQTRAPPPQHQQTRAPPPQHQQTRAPPPQHQQTRAPPPQHQQTRAPPPQHRRTPPPPSRQWRGPPRREESWLRPDQPDPRWRPGQQPRPTSRYVPRWSDQTDMD